MLSSNNEQQATQSTSCCPLSIVDSLKYQSKSCLESWSSCVTNYFLRYFSPKSVTVNLTPDAARQAARCAAAALTSTWYQPVLSGDGVIK